MNIGMVSKNRWYFCSFYFYPEDTVDAGVFESQLITALSKVFDKQINIDDFTVIEAKKLSQILLAKLNP